MDIDRAILLLKVNINNPFFMIDSGIAKLENTFSSRKPVCVTVELKAAVRSAQPFYSSLLLCLIGDPYSIMQS